MKYLVALLVTFFIQQTFASQAVVAGFPRQIKLLPTGYGQVPPELLGDISIGSIIYLMKVSPEAKEILSGTNVDLISLDPSRALDGHGIVRNFSLAGIEQMGDQDLKNAGVSYGLRSQAYLVSRCSTTGTRDWSREQEAGRCGITLTHLYRIRDLLNSFVFAPPQQGTAMSSGSQKVVR